MSRILLPCLALLLATRPALAGFPFACGTIGLRGEPVAIATESAIIIWDEAAKVQHFIRRATFQTAAENFGFLVPTPSRPELKEADDSAFDLLYEVTKPKVVEQKRPTGCACAIGCGGSKKDKNARAGKVDVLEESQIAGYDYAILKASDPDALKGWLEEKKYPFPPRLAEWVAPYLKGDFAITAFKITPKDPKKPDSAGEGVGTRAVRMSFATDKPYFPYREPKEDGEGKAGGLKNRLLRIYFLSKARKVGQLQKPGDWGRTAWAGKISVEKRQELDNLINLPEGTAPEALWLTEFEDENLVREGDDDLFFLASENQQPVVRRPHIRYVGRAWGGCVMSCALSAWLVGTMVRRRRKSSP